jgi:hypothetical protein
MRRNGDYRKKGSYDNKNSDDDDGDGDDDVAMMNGGVDFPQAFPDDDIDPSKPGLKRARDLKRKMKNDTKRDNNPGGWIVPFLVLFGIVMVGSYYLVSYHEERLVKHLKQDEVTHEKELSREFEIKYADLQEENERLKKQIADVDNLKRENEELLEDSIHARSLRENLEIQIERLSNYKKTMRQNIQLMSKTALLEK